jgi:hypothetical protein
MKPVAYGCNHWGGFGVEIVTNLGSKAGSKRHIIIGFSGQTSRRPIRGRKNRRTGIKLCS